MNKFLKYDIKPEFLTDDKNKAKIVIHPLETGFGTTLGNALRRVALSSIPGASIFAIKIPGYTHEYQAIDGVSEDITNIILNLKKLVIKVDTNIHSEEEFEDTRLESWPTLKINVNGPTNVTAADIVCPAGFEIINKDLVIANVTEKIEFNMEIFATLGRGFTTFTDNKDKCNSLSIIPTDSNFSPVLSFNYNVEEVKLSKISSSDKLTVELATNGSITATEALALASKILTAHLDSLITSDYENIVVMKEADTQETKQELFIPIEELDFTVRAYNALKSRGINTAHELIQLPRSEIEKIKNLGRKSIHEIIEKVHEHGLKLKDE